MSRIVRGLASVGCGRPAKVVVVVELEVEVEGCVAPSGAEVVPAPVALPQPATSKQQLRAPARTKVVRNEIAKTPRRNSLMSQEVSRCGHRSWGMPGLAPLGCRDVSPPEPRPRSSSLHGWNEDIELVSQEILDYARNRLRLDPVPLDGPRTFEQLQAEVGPTVTAEGIGGSEALRIFTETLAPACLSIDHPRYLSFIPCAPTEAAMLFDLVVGASSIYGGSWLEGAGAVFAENQALAWLAELAGFPDATGGAFVQGGTVANLSALVAARVTEHTAAHAQAEGREPRWAVAASSEAHSSVKTAASVMDVEMLTVDAGPTGRFDGAALEQVLDGLGNESGLELFAVVGTAGTTNLGVVEDLASLGEIADERGAWFHVDGAYGCRGACGRERAPEVRGHRAAPTPSSSIRTNGSLHRSTAPRSSIATPRRLEPRTPSTPATSNLCKKREIGTPLTSRSSSRGAQGACRSGSPWPHSGHPPTAPPSSGPWRSPVTPLAQSGRVPSLELISDPQLSVVCFRRLGWDRADYYGWSGRLLAEGVGFVTPTTVRGEVAARFAIVNPVTTEQDIDLILDTMR